MFGPVGEDGLAGWFWDALGKPVGVCWAEPPTQSVTAAKLRQKRSNLRRIQVERNLADISLQ